MPAEAFEPLMDALLGAGAKDVFLTPIVMKKARPGTKVSLLVDEQRLDGVLAKLFDGSTTIGARLHEVAKRMLPREERTIDTVLGAVRVKNRHAAERQAALEVRARRCGRHRDPHGVGLSDYQGGVGSRRGAGAGRMKSIEAILEAFREGDLDREQAADAIGASYHESLGHSTIDHDRPAPDGLGGSRLRRAQDAGTGGRYLQGHCGPRPQCACHARSARPAAAAALDAVHGAVHHAAARLVEFKQMPDAPVATRIAVVTAGTSDRAVAEEAALTAEFYGNPVLRISDVGVAGVHRLLARVKEIRHGPGGDRRRRHGGRIAERGRRLGGQAGDRRADQSSATAPPSTASRRCWEC